MLKIVLFSSIISVVYLIDQLSKYFMVRALSPGESVPVLKSIFHLTLIFNTGAAFGIMKGMSGAFMVITVLSLGLIAYFLFFRRKELPMVEAISLCFIAGGALGNLTDRVRLGYVIDFFDLRIWPVFNVADSFITVGALMLFLVLAMPRKKDDICTG